MSDEIFGELIGNIYKKIEIEIGNIPDSCYISGSISKNPDAKADFEKAEKYVVEKLGLTPINPIRFAEENGLIGEDKDLEYYSKIMLIDLMLVKFCKNIFMMKNWQTSNGAFNEHNYAMSIGKNIIYSHALQKPKYNQHIVNSFAQIAKHLEISSAELKRSKVVFYLIYKVILMYVFVNEYKYEETYVSSILNYERSSVYNAVKSGEQFLSKDFGRMVYETTIKPIVIEEFNKLMSAKEDDK